MNDQQGASGARTRKGMEREDRHMSEGMLLSILPRLKTSKGGTKSGKGDMQTQERED